MVKRWLYVILLCLLGVPMFVYWFGGLVVGPYEGERGILGMMTHIYTDALMGNLTAWVLLFSPLLLLGIWLFSLQLRRNIRG